MKRNKIRRFITDPLVGLGVWCVWTLFKILPLKVASKIGAGAGRLIYLFMRSRNQIALHNLEIAFPEKTVAERVEIIKNMWQHFGRFFAEMPHSKEWLTGAEVEGDEYLVATKEDGVGGFVCSAHLGNWEFASRYVSQNYYPLHPIYRPANNPWIERVMFQKRAGTLIPKGPVGARKLLELLKKGEHVAILCDQKFREGIPVPFFGKMAMTASAMVTFSYKMNLPLIMGKAIRMPDGHFKMTIIPVEKSKAADREIAEFETVQKINQVLEKWIRETPEQWMWIHRRFDKSEYERGNNEI